MPGGKDREQGRGGEATEKKKKGFESNQIESNQLEIQGADAGDGSSPEIEAAELQEPVLVLGLLLLLVAIAELAQGSLGLVKGEVCEPQPFQLGHVQPGDGHPPVDEGIVLAAHAVQHFQACEVGERKKKNRKSSAERAGVALKVAKKISRVSHGIIPQKRLVLGWV